MKSKASCREFVPSQGDDEDLLKLKRCEITRPLMEQEKSALAIREAWVCILIGVRTHARLFMVVLSAGGFRLSSKCPSPSHLFPDGCGSRGPQGADAF